MRDALIPNIALQLVRPSRAASGVVEASAVVSYEHAVLFCAYKDALECEEEAIDGVAAREHVLARDPSTERSRALRCDERPCADDLVN